MFIMQMHWKVSQSKHFTNLVLDFPSYSTYVDNYILFVVNL